MAINDAIKKFAGQQAAAASEYKNAWDSAPGAGVGQMSSPAPFKDAAGAPTFSIGGAAQPTPMPKPVGVDAGTSIPEQMQNKPLELGPSGPITDALQSGPALAPAAPPQSPAGTTGNFTAEKPYVSSVSDAGDVMRQGDRPERLAIDDTMSTEEQYRRAWQNEANGYYGNEPAVTPKPTPMPKPVGTDAAAAPAEAKEPPPKTEQETWWEQERDRQYREFQQSERSGN